ncbi:MAG: hypothetical protein WD577_11120 [Bacteroidales bacterium]
MIHIDKHTRNKLYWIDYSDPQKSFVNNKLRESNLIVLNLGYEFASYIKDKDEAQVRIMATDYLSEIMEYSANVDTSTKLPFVIMRNFGIMLENFLDIDVEKFLKDFSKNIGLVMLWEGTVKDNQQFFWPESEDYSLKFNDTNVNKIQL